MRRLIALLFAAGCGDAKQSAERAVTDNRPDSATMAAHEDSLMGKQIPGGPSVVSRYGDTLQGFNGWGIHVESPAWYDIDHYARNGIHYLSIGRRDPEEGVRYPRRLRRFTLSLPPMDSTDYIALQGSCRINGKDDRLVIAITARQGGAFYRPARHAWRFNVDREALEEIPAGGVTCSDVWTDE